MQDRPRPAAERGTAPPADALPARLLELQRRVGNQAVSRLLTGVAPVSSAKEMSIQRRIDPGYVAWRGAARVDSQALINQFVREYVRAELERLWNAPAEDTLKVQMKADWRAMTAAVQANPYNVAAAVTALNAVVTSINAVADDLSANIGQGDQFEDPEKRARRERTRRTGAKTEVGTTKPGPVRGLLSAAEGTALLNDLQTRVTNGLQGSDLAIGQVGVRGSSVTGLRSRGGVPFEWGTGQFQHMSDASDHDFFFTCTGLDPLITEHGGERSSANESGTMMWVYLRRLLDTLAEQTSGRPPRPTYPWAATLRDELIAFTAAAEAVTGRKSEVTYISPVGTTGAGLANDASTVIR